MKTEKREDWGKAEQQNLDREIENREQQAISEGEPQVFI